VTCREFTDFIDGYLSGELSAEETALFERHMSRCPNCHAYLANYRKTIDLERRALAEGEKDLPDVPDDLVNAILASSTPRRRRAPRGPRSRRNQS
jgi:anti-sigma factor RsiW